jgi:hypothetical protein
MTNDNDSLKDSSPSNFWLDTTLLSLDEKHFQVVSFSLGYLIPV